MAPCGSTQFRRASGYSIAVNRLYPSLDIMASAQSDRPHTIDAAHNDVEASAATEKITPAPQVVTTAEDDAPEKPEHMRPDASAQAGVQKVQAITLSWTKASLVAMLSL